MHAIVERDTILKALQFCDKIVDKKGSIPVLSNVLLSFSGNGASLTTTNLDEVASVTVPAETGGKVDITAPSDKLRTFINKLSKGAQIKLSHEKDSLVVTSNRSRMSLQTIPATDFPNFAPIEGVVTFTLDAKDVTTLFKRPQFAISTEETRYYLNGIFLAIHDGKLTAVATDGHRLAKVAVPAPEGAEQFQKLGGVIVPRASVARLIELAIGGAPISFEISKSGILARSGDLVYRTKLIDGTFPDWQRVVPGHCARKMTFDRAEMAVVTDRVSTVITERGRALRLKIDREAEEFSLTATTPDTGTAVETASYTGLEDDEASDIHCDEVGLNGRYLLDILATMTGENVEVHLADAGSPMKFTDATDPDALFVLMPMRI